MKNPYIQNTEGSLETQRSIETKMVPTIESDSLEYSRSRIQSIEPKINENSTNKIESIESSQIEIPGEHENEESKL